MKDNEIMNISQYGIDKSKLSNLPLSYQHIKYNHLVSAETESRFVIRDYSNERFVVYHPFDRLISKVLDYSTIN